jgi:hypothetical protein
MKKLENFENGLSIVQLEERYEMAASGNRSRDNEFRLDVHV